MVSTLLLTAALAAASPVDLDADLRAVAALPGEPSIVSAAGVTRDERAILTIENPWALDPVSTRRRAVIYAGPNNDQQTAAVLAMVRWFKTAAPAELREAWAISAIPSGDFDAEDKKSKDRWIGFQAPDVAIEVVAEHGYPTGLGISGVWPWVVHPEDPPQTLANILRTTKLPQFIKDHPEGRGWREEIDARIARDPLAIAKLLAARYPETPSISYIPALSWIGALRVADLTGDDALRDKVRRQTQPWTTGSQPLFGDRIQLTSIAGTMVFAELARRGDDLSAALSARGAQLAGARKPTGIAEYGQGWTDDMFMAASIIARDSQRKGSAADLDAAARLLLDYAKRLQRPDGIFMHAADGPFAWGRGNGFAAFGLIEALSALPESHKDRAALLAVYRRLMSGVRQQQAPDGMWREVIDEPGAYREESATAMLLTAMLRGIRRGWLDDSYGAAATRAWRALAAHVAEDGTIIDICTGTGAGPTKRYYLDRAAVTGADDRGGAMALTAALEMVESKSAGR
jgi:rhamnogalacturonyl hydrolase YesR